MHLRGQTTTFQTRLEISGHTAAGLNDPKLQSEWDAPSGRFASGVDDGDSSDISA